MLPPCGHCITGRQRGALVAASHAEAPTRLRSWLRVHKPTPIHMCGAVGTQLGPQPHTRLDHRYVPPPLRVLEVITCLLPAMKVHFR